MTMLKNHLVGACRSLIKQGSYSLIHIVGLAIGLTAGIYVLHYARLEYSYDKFHPEADNIFRVITTRMRDGQEATRFASTFAGAGPAMKAVYPEIESYTRIFRRWRGGVINYGDTRFREKDILHVDSGFFKVFSFPLLSGSPADLFPPGSAFVEEATAKKYFGEESPVGKRITFGGSDGIEEYEIRGVIRCPENSSIKFTFIFSYNDLSRLFGSEHLTNWQWLDFHTFIKLHEQVNPKVLEGRFDELLKKHRGERAANSRLTLQPLTDMYLTSSAEFETGITGNESTVRILLVLGIIVLLIVALNFMNLSTSQAFARAREVGIRKTLGSSRTNLVARFLLETTLIHVAAMIVCCLLIWLCLPLFNQLTDRHIRFVDFVSSDLWKYLGISFLAGSAVMGIYPALQLSSFRPVDVLKGLFIPRGRGAFLREVFVGFQALVSFSLVASILIIISQVQFVGNQELGIAVDKTLAVQTPQTILDLTSYSSTLEVFKSELSRDNRILSVTTSADSPGEAVNWIGGARRLGAPLLEGISIYRSVIDADYVTAMGLHMIAGKSFGRAQRPTDVLINRSGVKAFGYENEEAAIGQVLVMNADTCTIVGVVEDFHHVSPKEPIMPTLFHYNLEPARYFFIRFSGESADHIVALAQTVFKELYPQEPFDYYFLDEFYDSQNASERTLTSIIMVFCVLAVVVSSLGLLGLTWFRISRQKKELAVRKIVGSSEAQLFLTASRRMMQTTSVGCAIGIPVTWFLMTRWLEGFSMHTTMKPWQFAAAFVVSMAVAVLTVSAYTWKVIRANPADHLRSE